MALTTINNGAFENDPSAETIRSGFEKVNTQFTEIFAKIPLELASSQGLILKVKADETGFELVSAGGSGDMLGSNNLSDVVNVSTARTNLGLGDASTSDVTDFATSAQGVKADSAIQSIGAGTGVSVDATDPLNPIVNANAVVPTSLSFAPLTGILTLALAGGTDITIDLSDYTVLKIDGYQVEKGAGNTNPTTIEDDDKGFGFDGDTFHAWKQVSGVKEDMITGSIF